jgi:hypothetical protein
MIGNHLCTTTPDCSISTGVGTLNMDGDGETDQFSSFSFFPRPHHWIDAHRLQTIQLEGQVLDLLMSYHYPIQVNPMMTSTPVSKS